jgi:hypothetical protein
MHETGGWAGHRRRRWSASRIAAAVALHALALLVLRLAIDRVEVPHAADRATRLLMVALHTAPPPPIALPTPARSPARAGANASASRTRGALRPPSATAQEPQAITLPSPPASAIVAASPAASSPPHGLDFLDNAATRQALRDAGRGQTLAGRANALTHEDPGSELVAADGSHCNCKRNLPPPPPAQALAQDIAAAHKNDCMKGEFAGAGMGLLSAPFLLAAEAMGKCAHKL